MTPEGNKRLDLRDNIESLRCILESQQSRAVTYEEASDIGDSLIAFYEILGSETIDGQ